MKFFNKILKKQQEQVAYFLFPEGLCSYKFIKRKWWNPIRLIKGDSKLKIIKNN